MLTVHDHGPKLIKSLHGQFSLISHKTEREGNFCLASRVKTAIKVTKNCFPKMPVLTNTACLLGQVIIFLSKSKPCYECARSLGFLALEV